jgi:hypothetical protein
LLSKCIHCDSYQDWRGNISLGGTVLSLLVAVFSVLTVAVPVLVAALSLKNSDLIFTLQYADADKIEMLASNVGSRPGTMSSFARVIDQDKSVLLQYQLDVDASGFYWTLPAAYYEEASMDLTLHSTERSRCEIVTNQITFKGAPKIVTVPADLCSEFKPFLQHAARIKLKTKEHH